VEECRGVKMVLVAQFWKHVVSIYALYIFGTNQRQQTRKQSLLLR